MHVRTLRLCSDIRSFSKAFFLSTRQQETCTQKQYKDSRKLRYKIYNRLATNRCSLDNI